MFVKIHIDGSLVAVFEPLIPKIFNVKRHVWTGQNDTSCLRKMQLSGKAEHSVVLYPSRYATPIRRKCRDTLRISRHAADQTPRISFFLCFSQPFGLYFGLTGCLTLCNDVNSRFELFWKRSKDQGHAKKSHVKSLPRQSFVTNRYVNVFL